MQLKYFDHCNLHAADFSEWSFLPSALCLVFYVYFIISMAHRSNLLDPLFIRGLWMTSNLPPPGMIQYSNLLEFELIYCMLSTFHVSSQIVTIIREHPFSVLNKSLDLAERNITRKYTIPIVWSFLLKWCFFQVAFLIYIYIYIYAIPIMFAFFILVLVIAARGCISVQGKISFSTHIGNWRRVAISNEKSS